MKMRMLVAGVLPALSSLALSGCASDYGWQTQTASAGFVDGTQVLGELVMNPTREQALSGAGIFRGWAGKLGELGYAESDIVDGSTATAWAYCYGHNSGVPLCTHHGHYVVRVPPEFRGGLNFDDDGADTSGDLVEIELTATPSGQVVGTLVGIYRKSGDWRDCRIAGLDTGSTSAALSILGGVGPPQANWLECDNAGMDGWLRRPVVGAPPSRTTPVSEWVRLPGS